MTLLDFLLILGAALSLHRIWNYEPVCAKLRGLFEPIKPISCPVCNPFWIGAAVFILWFFAPASILAALACFLPVRIAIWAYERPEKPTPQVAPQVIPPPVLLPPPVVQTSKSTRTVVILTTLSDFKPAYSVAQEAVNSARGIGLANPDWQVQVWTTERTDAALWPNMPPNVLHRPIVPSVPWHEDKEDDVVKDRLEKFLRKELTAISGPVSVITHDLMLVTWYLNFARAIHAVKDLANIRWWHVCHSLVGNAMAVPAARCTVPSEAHTIVTVAPSGVDAFKLYYKTDRVVHVPNVRDPRTLGVSLDVQRIVTHMRLGDAAAVQIFPACSTRLEAKGFIKVARVFAHLNHHMDAKLVVCNPNASGERSMGILKKTREDARSVGLADDKWCLSSALIPDKATSGLPAIDIHHLLHFYGNICVFPSISEADSLVVLEARLARQFIITNSSVPSMTGGNWSVPWGTSVEESADREQHAAYASARIMEHLARDHLEINRRYVLKTRNLEGIGNMWGSLLNAAGPLPSEQ